MSEPLILECYNTGTHRTILIVFQCIASFFYKYIPMIFAKTLKFVSTVMSAVCFLSVTAQTVQMKAPDFAYPQTVSEDARRNLDKALREDTPRDVLHSLSDYTLARSSTDAAPRRGGSMTHVLHCRSLRCLQIIPNGRANSSATVSRS